MNFNRVILGGRLTRDPELRYTSKGTAVATVGLAVNQSWTDDAGQKREDVLFIDCAAFGRTAEVLKEHSGGKGHTVLVEGRLKLEQWEDKASNQKRSKISMHIERLSLIGDVRTGNGNGDAPPPAPPASQAKEWKPGFSRPAREPADPADPDAKLPF